MNDNSFSREAKTAMWQRARGPALPAIAAATAALGACLVMVALTGPASAGRWISGGTYDVRRGVGVNFMRFLADTNEGQLTIRCDPVEGLWIDAGVTGNAELPSGVQPESAVEARFTFIRNQGEDQITVTGGLYVREDGAVLVSVAGNDAAALGPPLLVPAERVDVTIGGATRSVPLDGQSELFSALADRCGAWPR